MSQNYHRRHSRWYELRLTFPILLIATLVIKLNEKKLLKSVNNSRLPKITRFTHKFKIDKLLEALKGVMHLRDRKPVSVKLSKRSEKEMNNINFKSQHRFNYITCFSSYFSYDAITRSIVTSFDAR